MIDFKADFDNASVVAKCTEFWVYHLCKQTGIFQNAYGLMGKYMMDFKGCCSREAYSENSCVLLIAYISFLIFSDNFNQGQWQKSGKHLREINMVMILDNRLKKQQALRHEKHLEDKFSYPVQNYKNLDQRKNTEVE